MTTELFLSLQNKQLSATPVGRKAVPCHRRRRLHGGKRPRAEEEEDESWFQAPSWSLGGSKPTVFCHQNTHETTLDTLFGVFFGSFHWYIKDRLTACFWRVLTFRSSLEGFWTLQCVKYQIHRQHQPRLYTQYFPSVHHKALCLKILNYIDISLLVRSAPYD